MASLQFLLAVCAFFALARAKDRSLRTAVRGELKVGSMKVSTMGCDSNTGPERGDCTTTLGQERVCQITNWGFSAEWHTVYGPFEEVEEEWLRFSEGSRKMSTTACCREKVCVQCQEEVYIQPEGEIGAGAKDNIKAGPKSGDCDDSCDLPSGADGLCKRQEEAGFSVSFAGGKGSCCPNCKFVFIEDESLECTAQAIEESRSQPLSPRPGANNDGESDNKEDSPSKTIEGEVGGKMLCCSITEASQTQHNVSAVSPSASVAHSCGSGKLLLRRSAVNLLLLRMALCVDVGQLG